MFTTEEIISNWETFIENVKEFTEGERQEKLLTFYIDREDDISLIPASSSIHYHSAVPGGYVKHVNNVVELCQYQYRLWQKFDAVDGFTLEELIFAAIHHDMGKIGDMEHILYQETSEKWKNDKGTYYEYNPKIEFLSIPDRSLYLLNVLGVPLTFNEYLSIKIHDGLYDDANKIYLLSQQPKIKNNMPYILSHADQAAARIEHSAYSKYLSETQKGPEVDTKLKKVLNNL